MTRALLCSVLLLSLSCSSSGSDSGSADAGSSSSSAGSGNQNHGGSSNNAAGASGTTNGTAGGTNGTAGTSNGTAGTGTSTGGTANGTAGAAGTGTSAGAAGVGTTGGATGAGGGAAASESVTQWGGDIARTAHWVNASLTKANAAKMALDTFSDTGATNISKFAGEVSALPLFLAGTTPGAGEYIAVTTQNDVYAFNETTGKLVWQHNVGANLGAGGSLCGTPSNHGIVSTPVIDAAARVIYLAAGLSSNTYQIHALSADTGMELTTPGWPVDVSKVKSGTLAFPSTVQIQRSALALVGGVVYVAFGGYCGDQGNYHGWVVAVNGKDPTQTGAWATMDARQGGIWAPGGMASDGTGVFAVTGNVASVTGTDHSKSDSEEIIRITGMGVASHATKDVFYPTEWSPMNAGDLDFGSSSPVIMNVPGSTPSSIIVAPAKGGRVYFLETANLGATLGQFADMAVANTSGQSVYTSPTAYQSATGAYAAIVTGAGSQCPSVGGVSGVNDGSVMSILMQPGSPPMPKMAWCAKVGTDGATVKRSPISTNSAGTADALVWVLNGSKLNAFDGDTGAAVFSGGTGTCGGVHSFTTLIETNGHIVTGGDSAGQAHLCSWSVHN
jgi:hypothetical protein